MPTNIFSTYSTGENRVTASILAVLQALSLGRIERLLGELLGQPELTLVSFNNQVSDGGVSIPDATISASFRLLVETKIFPNKVNRSQLEAHLQLLQPATESQRILLVITPDDRRPAVFEELDNPMLVWAPFSALDQAIDELLSDPKQVVSERESFLLRELQDMFLRTNLVATENDVVVVAARSAWPEYESYHAYVCQPDRPFQLVKRMAFYSHGKINPLVPLVLEVFQNVPFIPAEHSGKLRELIELLLAKTSRKEGESYKVMLLSAPNAPETVNLGHEIPNNLTTEGGRPWAFTLGQRYVLLDRLRKAKTTSDLASDVVVPHSKKPNP